MGRHNADNYVMAIKTIIRLCMGSACHQYGVYEVLPALQKLLTVHNLDATVEIRGAFCLGPCINGIVLEVGEQQIVNINPQDIEQRFKSEILPYLRQ